MKYSILVLLLSISIFLCTKEKNFYQGYICNQKKEPLTGYKIFEKENEHNSDTTNKDGFFKIKMKNDWISHYLMVESPHKEVIDSIQVIRISGGEKLRYFFVEGRKDTLFLKAK